MPELDERTQGSVKLLSIRLVNPVRANDRMFVYIMDLMMFCADSAIERQLEDGG